MIDMTRPGGFVKPLIGVSDPFDCGLKAVMLPFEAPIASVKQ